MVTLRYTFLFKAFTFQYVHAESKFTIPGTTYFFLIIIEKHAQTTQSTENNSISLVWDFDAWAGGEGGVVIY